MKATELGKRLKTLTETSSYDEALVAVEQMIAEPAPRPPVGVSLVLELAQPGLYWPALLGTFQSLDEIKMLQAACRDFANVTLANVLELAIMAEVSNADKPTTEK